ncbi:MAG: hypothetical protein NC420_14080 [Eubacterium sp.]|nr:hypothetical protein [Eubacterium sp.]MCM1343976.1 hypothetical protein [Muribaculaceae bacterium]MCM1411458.1 hypothetical protein [Lachnospiraceae bacterium]
MKKEKFRVFRLFMTDMRRAVCSPQFCLGVAGVSALMLAAVFGIQSSVESVWSLMRLATQGSGFESIELCVFPVFAYGMSYALEWEQKVQRFLLIRSGVTEYMISKLTACFLSGFLTVFLGLAVFIVLWCPFYPLYDHPISSFRYEELMLEGKILEGYLYYMVHQGITGGISAVCGAWISTIRPNQFAAASAPLVLYFCLLRVAEGLAIPEALKPLYWEADIYDGSTAGETLLIKIGISAVLCVVMGFCALINAKRRLLRE